MPKEFKLATYNIHDGRELNSITKNILDMARRDVNLFCLQEIRNGGRYPFIGDSLLKELGSNWKAEYFLTEKQNFDHGLAILWDSSQVENLMFKKLALPKLDKLNWWATAFHLIHRSPPIPIERGSLVGWFKINGQILRISNVHLDFAGGIKQRSRQVEFLLESLKVEAPADSEIICGDFNTIGFFPGNQFKIISTILGDQFSSIFSKPVSTSVSFQALDYIFTKGLKINDRRVLKFKGSDHFSIEVSFILF